MVCCELYTCFAYCWVRGEIRTVDLNLLTIASRSHLDILICNSPHVIVLWLLVLLVNAPQETDHNKAF